MTQYNSIRPANFLLYLIILLATGCAKTTTQALINQEPTAAGFALVKRPVDSIGPNINNEFLIVKPQVIQHKTAWDRLFALYSLPEIENERIENEIQNYLNHPQFLVKIQQRAEPYLHFILDEIEAKKIPGEIALLPVIESSFRPTAISKSRASGLWQFIPATGRLFGLKQNWWYDGRNDIYASTRAATTYLQQLSNRYENDWLLALAAYNAGLGNIGKAIRKNEKKDLPTDYWSLPLTKETTNYIPRLLAIAKILANSEKYNIPLHPIPNKPYFTVVNLDSQIDLGVAAELAKTSVDDFFSLNPGYKRWTTHPDGPHHLLIHTDKADAFKDKFEHTLKKDRMKWVRHTIKQGEYLGSIAKQYRTSVKAIRKTNRLKKDNIRAGRFLLIPKPLAKAYASKANRRLYIVKKGDTFWDIARQFRVKSKDIASWNNLSLKKALYPGQKLIIKKG